MRLIKSLAASLILAGISAPLAAQTTPATAPSAAAMASPAVLIAEQRTALEKFARMDGLWRGTAWTLLPNGQKHEITQTERIGPLLDGSIKVVEGRGYEPDGRTTFNAFAVISWDTDSKAYRIRSHAQGRYGDFAIRPTDDGYVWEIPMGPALMRYTATIRDGVLKEVGDRVVPGREPQRVFEMVLNRIGDSPWPGAGAVPLK